MSSYHVSISHINVQAREILHVISNPYDTLILWITQLILSFYLKILQKI